MKKEGRYGLGGYVITFANMSVFDKPKIASRKRIEHKPEQMVKKVFVFTDFSCRGIDWKPSYEAVRSKFKEQGYGDDAIPKVLIWGLFDLNMPSIVEPHPGLKILSGYSDNLGKVFLDNGGEIGPHQLMEAAIADKEYQALSVVD